MEVSNESEFLLDQLVSPALAPGGDKLGEPQQGTSIELESVHVRTGASYVVSLESLLERAGKSTLESQVLLSSDAWIVYHNFSISPQQRGKGPIVVGLEVEFDRPSQIVTTEIFPQARFVDVLSGRTELEFRAGVGLNGEALPVVTPSANASAQIVAEMAFNVRTPEIVTTGRFSSRIEWLFYKRTNPLIGDFQVAHSILAPKGATEASFLHRVQAAVSGSLPGFPAPLLPSPWARKSLELRDTDLSRLASLRMPFTG